MNEPKMIVTLDDLVVEFASNFSLGMKAIKAAAETYATAINKYPTKARDEFARRFPTVRAETWAIIEDIGRGKLPPQTTMMAPGAVAKLREAKLPRQLMEKVAEQRVTVYNTVTGKYTDIPFAQLTESQADIVLNPVSHSIRTKEQQRRYLEQIGRAGKAAKPGAVKSPDWVVDGDTILVKRMTRLTAEDLRTMLAKLEGGK